MYEMVDKYREGFDIVYGVRSDRETDTWFKRTSAQVYYKTLNRMGAEVVYNHADYRLVSSLVLQEFSDFQEVNLFLRGLFPLVGFKSTCVYYSRHKRRPRFIVSSRTWEETDAVPASDRPVSHKQVDREKEEQEKLLQ